ncbi:MAG: transcriptional repressor LexA [Elusimicrobia bacterium]|nr:transcriptional repressor LexA [Elusimicrobiota bacterium]
MPTTPTARQKQVLDFIHGSAESRGYAPSLREIAAHLGIKGTRAVEKHVAALEKKGFLKRGEGARAVAATGRPAGRAISIIGRVAAGTPITAEENVERTLTLDPDLVRGRNVFGLRVRGDSMTGAGILDGDVVLVRPQGAADPGEIVVAMTEGEATVKRLARKDGRFWLLPENPAYKPIDTRTAGAGFELVGKVVGVVRMWG